MPTICLSNSLKSRFWHFSQKTTFSRFASLAWAGTDVPDRNKGSRERGRSTATLAPHISRQTVSPEQLPQTQCLRALLGARPGPPSLHKPNLFKPSVNTNQFFAIMQEQPHLSDTGPQAGAVDETIDPPTPHTLLYVPCANLLAQGS